MKWKSVKIFIPTYDYWFASFYFDSWIFILPVSSDEFFSGPSDSSSFVWNQLPLLLPVEPRGEQLFLRRVSYNENT